MQYAIQTTAQGVNEMQDTSETSYP